VLNVLGLPSDTSHDCGGITLAIWLVNCVAFLLIWISQVSPFCIASARCRCIQFSIDLALDLSRSLFIVLEKLTMLIEDNMPTSMQVMISSRSVKPELFLKVCSLPIG
jgi:hypothetical protein